MSTKKTLNEQIEIAQKKIEQDQNYLKQLKQRQKEQERKERNHRLCKRHGILESIIPEMIDITDEQFEMFVKQHIANGYGRNMLAKIIKMPFAYSHANSTAEELQADETPR